MPKLGRNVTHKDLPNISIAVSGGAMRAFLLGAGILHAFDERNDDALNYGVAGILQLVNHISGVSGSACLFRSDVAND